MSELGDREWLEGLAAMVINAPTRDRLLRIAATLGERVSGRTPEPSEEAIEAAREASAHTSELGMDDILVSRRVTLRMLRAAYVVDLSGRTPSEPSAADVLNWLRNRPGASWIATIHDIERALAEIAKDPSSPGPDREGET